MQWSWIVNWNSKNKNSHIGNLWSLHEIKYNAESSIAISVIIHQKGLNITGVSILHC